MPIMLRAFMKYAACLAMLAALGCQRSAPPLRVYCGAGIRPPVAEIAAQFGRQRGVTVECDYAGSEVLLSRIKLSREGDVYLPGDTYYVQEAVRAGLIASSRDVAYFVPVIQVQKGNPKGVRSLADLTRPGIRVGLGDAKACAVGRIASEIFRKNGIAEKDVQVVFRSLTVDELANNVRLGALDAAIVWDAVAARTADRTDVVLIPPAENVVSTIPAAVLRTSAQPDLARAFLDYLAGDEGKSIFRKHHYTVTLPQNPPP